MAAFAANSVLCRLALRTTAIDPGTFTAIRLAAGAAALWGITSLRSHEGTKTGGTWLSAAALFIYAAAFSFAYITLTTGTGALILFGAVQLSMIGWGVARGERLRPVGVVGAFIAVSGLVVLVAPGLEAPAPGGAVLMAGAGVAWGVYSLRGRSSDDPAADTSGNFLRATVMAAGLIVALAPTLVVDAAGVTYALLSGAVASAMGYVIWYSVLPHMPAMSASLVQLSVPVIAAAAGILILNEPLTPRLLFASIATLGGIGVALRARRGLAVKRS